MDIIDNNRRQEDVRGRRGRMKMAVIRENQSMRSNWTDQTARQTDRVSQQWAICHAWHGPPSERGN
eukprot:scaffold1537_cov162-Ochromonas_danica.AAC.9